MGVPLAATFEIVPEKEQRTANFRQTVGSLKAVGSLKGRSSSLPSAPPMSDDVLDDGLHEGGTSERVLNPQNYRRPAFTGEFKIGKPRCARDNCPYACTGVSRAVMRVGSTARNARGAGTSQLPQSGSTTTGSLTARHRNSHCCFRMNATLSCLQDSTLKPIIRRPRSPRLANGEQMSLETL